MKEKYLKILIYCCGIIALTAAMAIRNRTLINLFLKEKIRSEYIDEDTKYGELYYSCFISHFREDIPPSDPKFKYRLSPKNPDLHKADILTFGDSFLDYNRMITFPERLADTLHKKVFYARDNSPLRYLVEKNYRNAHPKILIYESAERYMDFRFSKPHNSELKEDNRSGIRKTAAFFRDNIFMKDAEIRYGILLSRSYLIGGIYSFISTLKFDVFGYIPETTPVYTLEHKDPWLFYYEEVDKDVKASFYYQYSVEEIETYCDNIADLSAKLRNEYNLQLVFFPIPSKYTIYHKLLNDDAYNNFLPRLYEGLEKRGIPVVKIYEEYKNSKEILYFGTDTHWNKKGLDIALDQTLKTLNNELYKYLALDRQNKAMLKH